MRPPASASQFRGPQLLRSAHESIPEASRCSTRLKSPPSLPRSTSAGSTRKSGTESGSASTVTSAQRWCSLEDLPMMGGTISWTWARWPMPSSIAARGRSECPQTPKRGTASALPTRCRSMTPWPGVPDRHPRPRHPGRRVSGAWGRVRGGPRPLVLLRDARAGASGSGHRR